MFKVTLPQCLLYTVMKVGHLIDVSWSHNVLRAHSVHYVLSKLLLDVRVGGQAVQTPSKCMGCLKGGKQLFSLNHNCKNIIWG